MFFITVESQYYEKDTAFYRVVFCSYSIGLFITDPHSGPYPGRGAHRHRSPNGNPLPYRDTDHRTH